MTLTLTLTKVRLFRYATGKTRRTYDEGVEALHELQKGGDEAYRLEAFDFGRRMAVEREYRANQDAAPSSVCFDETGKLMLFA
jgi:peptidylprolyl isomerase domain and WD repeat-containing protein 1